MGMNLERDLPKKVEKFKKHIGEKYNNFTIIDVDIEKHKEDIIRHRLGKLKLVKLKYVCKCDCGNIRTVTYEDLKNNKSKSCGCIQKESKKDRKIKLGETYNKLTTFDYVLEVNKKTNKKKIFHLCKCSCGSDKIIKTQLYRLKSGKVKSCGCFLSDKKKNGLYRKLIKRQFNRSLYYRKLWRRLF